MAFRRIVLSKKRRHLNGNIKPSDSLFLTESVTSASFPLRLKKCLCEIIIFLIQKQRGSHFCFYMSKQMMFYHLTILIATGSIISAIKIISKVGFVIKISKPTFFVDI